MSTEAIEARLDTFRRGELAMAQLAMERLRAAIGALLDGNFDDACDRAREAVGKLQPLALSQNAFSRLAAGATIVRAGEVEPGMTVIGWGVVSEVESIDPVDPGFAAGALISYTDPAGAEQQQTMGADSELIVFPAGGGSE